MPWRARWWWLIPVGVLALLLLAATALLLLVDPNRFRPRLQAEIAARTGWKVSVGELHWRLWPHVAVSIDAGSVDGESEAAPPLRWRAIAVSAQWRALLHGELALDRIEIEGLALALAVDRDGRGNWQALLERLQTAQSRPAASAAGPEPGRPLQLAALVLRDADMQYTDARSDLHAHAAHANASLALTTDRGGVRLTDLKLDTQLSGGPLPGSVPVAFAAPTLTWAAPMLTLPTWTLHAANATLEGMQPEPARFTPLVASGRLHAHCTSLRELLTTLGMPPPPTRDRAVLGETEVAAEWSWQGGALNLPALTVTADGIRLTGQARWSSRPQPRLTLQATGGAVDLDRYLTPLDYKSPPLQLPAATLKSLPIAGTLSFESARLHGVILQGVRLQLAEATP
jgi:AsmA protein